MPKRISTGYSKLAKPLVLAISSGILLGLTYPPFGYSWLIWFALIPLLWAIHEHRQPFLTGYIAGFIFCLIVTHPLTSAHEWTGWMVDAAPGEREERIASQHVILHLLWPMLAAWGALFWGVFALLLSKLTNGNLSRMALFAPPLAIVLTEWLRSITVWDYQWAFLGAAAIPFEAILQLGALGGAWLISWLVVLVNVGVLAVLLLYRNSSAWRLPTSILIILTLVIAGGIWRADRLESMLAEREDGIRVAAIQYDQAETTLEDYTTIGLEASYLNLMAQVAGGAAGEVDLIVLPESIAFGAFSLDGSLMPDVSKRVQWRRDGWEQAISWVTDHGDPDVAIIMGLDTIEDTNLHNSLIFWVNAKATHHYHKQRLVPFAEYQPAIMDLLGLRGRKQYQSGNASRVGQIHGISIGSFICQEVLIPSVTRQSTRNGAELLVSGGNDGVFQNPAVAAFHADLARLRAVETGRYLVRAMKNGISAIISPTGVELSRSPSSEPYVLADQIRPTNHLTPYVRFGDWVVWLAFIVIGAGVTHQLTGPGRARRETKTS